MTPMADDPAPTPLVDVPPALAQPHALDIVFTGSGSEYLRIWIVNLLLTVLTVGIYYPWAKVRRLRYFYGNTLVGGHALDFHGQPMNMLRGLVLIVVLGVVSSNANRFSPLAGFLAFLLIAAIWPLMFRSSQRFRLANTSWRGLRLRFTGSTAGAYRAVLLPFLLVVLVGLLSGLAGGIIRAAHLSPNVAPGLGLLGTLLAAPLFWWLLKKYQHDHYAIGQWQTGLRAGGGAFSLLLLKIVGVALLGMLAAGVVVAVAVFAISSVGVADLFREAGAPRGAVAVMLGITTGFLALYAAFVLVIAPYAISRTQNLVWGRTRSDDLWFESRLRFWPLWRLTLKNWLLMLLTFGLYWPFAKVATARLRLQAVSLTTRVSPEELIARAGAGAGEATGDAGADMFGIDPGL